MRVLGLDPGTATTGYGIIEGVNGRFLTVTYGVIRTQAQDPMPQRLQQIYQGITDLITTYQPDTAGVEEVFFGRNITTAITVGQARGVLLLALANAGLTIGEYSPPKIKDSVTGYGKADKAQIRPQENGRTAHVPTARQAGPQPDQHPIMAQIHAVDALDDPFFGGYFIGLEADQFALAGNEKNVVAVGNAGSAHQLVAF
jgi:crossover junction endodeoxyribonuclease RuvC